MDVIKQIQNVLISVKEMPAFKAGDTVTVTYKIIEGNKEREQEFQGVVLQRKGDGATQTFTVRKISNGVGVERIFPLYSPKIVNLEVNKKGIVRRARIFYLRGLSGKAARIEEKIVKTADKPAKVAKVKVAKVKADKPAKAAKAK